MNKLFVYNMSKKRCCTVDGCKEANVSLHTLPKEKSVRDQWLQFIFYRIPQNFSPYLLVCSAHFTADSFTNLAQYNAGFAKKLRTKDTAVPTLFGPTSTPQPVSKRSNDVYWSSKFSNEASTFDNVSHEVGCRSGQCIFFTMKQTLQEEKTHVNGCY